VRQGVEEAIAEHLAYENVAFGQSIYLSAVHNAIEDVPGVRLVTITRFRRRDDTNDVIAKALAESHLPALDQLPPVLRQALEREVEADGRIELSYFEIPVPGDVDVRAVVAPR
jgi:hypothetical protein